MDRGKRYLYAEYLDTQSEGAKVEKSIRKGHISTLHVWWGRRPLVACHAVVYGALVPADQFRPKNGPLKERNSFGRFLSPVKEGAMVTPWNSFSACLLAKSDRIGGDRLDLLHRSNAIPLGVQLFLKKVSHKAPPTHNEGGAFLFCLPHEAAP